MFYFLNHVFSRSRPQTEVWSECLLMWSCCERSDWWEPSPPSASRDPLHHWIEVRPGLDRMGRLGAASAQKHRRKSETRWTRHSYWFTFTDSHALHCLLDQLEHVDCSEIVFPASLIQNNKNYTYMFQTLYNMQHIMKMSNRSETWILMNERQIHHDEMIRSSVILQEIQTKSEEFHKIYHSLIKIMCKQYLQFQCFSDLLAKNCYWTLNCFCLIIIYIIFF